MPSWLSEMSVVLAAIATVLWLWHHQTPASGHPDKVFLEFDPLPLKQHAGKPSLAFDTFDAALDAFFAKASDVFFHSRLSGSRPCRSYRPVCKAQHNCLHHQVHVRAPCDVAALQTHNPAALMMFGSVPIVCPQRQCVLKLTPMMSSGLVEHSGW